MLMSMGKEVQLCQASFQSLQSGPRTDSDTICPPEVLKASMRLRPETGLKEKRNHSPSGQNPIRLQEKDPVTPLNLITPADVFSKTPSFK